MVCGVDEFFSTACDLVEKTTRERRVEREKKKGMRVGEWGREWEDGIVTRA